jgi:peptide/nickel transport system substrate-binding protein
MPTDPATLEVTKVETYTVYFNMDEIWSNLVQYKSDFYTQVEFIGDLADRWEVNDAGDKYTFFMNPNARWQNLPPLNGRKITSADVKYGYELFKDEEYKSQMRSRLRAIDSIDTPDDSTLVLNLTEPASNVLFDLAWPTLKIHARELVDQGLIGTEEGLIGSGAFIFQEWQKGSVIKMARSTNYWRDGSDGSALPYLDSIESIIVADPITISAALGTNKLDFANITGVRKSQAEPLLENTSVEVIPGHSGSVRILWMKHDYEPFSHKLVRQAILKAVDPAEIKKAALEAEDMPLESFVYSTAGDRSLPQERLLEIQGVDVPAARALLAEAGFSDGFKIEVLVQGPSSPGPEIAALIQQQWQEVGIAVSIAAPTQSVFIPRRRNGDFHVASTFLNLQADPVAQLGTQMRTGAGRNYGGYSNPEADALMDKAKGEFDQAKLKEILYQAQEVLWEDVPAIPMSQGQSFQIQWDYLKGFKNNFAWGNQGLKFAWLDK